MANRNVHYEAAFENYLRTKALPYVSVDEAKKATFGKISLKSFDVLKQPLYLMALVWRSENDVHC